MKTTPPLPPTFIRRIQRQFPDDADDLLAALDQPPATSIHLHPKKGIASFYAKHEKVPWYASGVFLEKRPVFTWDPLFHAGSYYPQESSSMFIGYLLEQLFGQEKKLTCLDFCAAPGGKSLLISDFIGNEGRLVANEIHKTRNSILQENLIRWGVPNFIVTRNDAASFSAWGEFFDVVLADAPCSGEGMFRKDPNARAEWSEAHVLACSVRQKNLLDDLIPCIKPGGYLIYSTCTFAREENEDICTGLKKKGLSPVHFPVPQAWPIRVMDSSDFFAFQFLPHLVRGEGFFVAVFKKENTDRRRVTSPHRKPKGKPKGKPHWRPLEKNEADLLLSYTPHIKYAIADPKGEIVCSPFSPQALHDMAQHGYTTQAGLPIGKVIRGEWIPHHGSAMIEGQKLHTPHIELDLPDALAYLRREPFALAAPPSGWALVTYQHIPLGWIKGTNGRINPYYPTEWRIRMR